MAVAYFLQWTIIGIVIDLIYKPLIIWRMAEYSVLFASNGCGFCSTCE